MKQLESGVKSIIKTKTLSMALKSKEEVTSLSLNSSLTKKQTVIKKKLPPLKQNIVDMGQLGSF